MLVAASAYALAPAEALGDELMASLAVPTFTWAAAEMFDSVLKRYRIDSRQR